LKLRFQCKGHREENARSVFDPTLRGACSLGASTDIFFVVSALCFHKGGTINKKGVAASSRGDPLTSASGMYSLGLWSGRTIPALSFSLAHTLGHGFKYYMLLLFIMLQAACTYFFFSYFASL